MTPAEILEGIDTGNIAARKYYFTEAMYELAEIELLGIAGCASDVLTEIVAQRLNLPKIPRFDIQLGQQAKVSWREMDGRRKKKYLNAASKKLNIPIPIKPVKQKTPRKKIVEPVKTITPDKTLLELLT